MCNYITFLFGTAENSHCFRHILHVSQDFVWIYLSRRLSLKVLQTVKDFTSSSKQVSCLTVLKNNWNLLLPHHLLGNDLRQSLLCGEVTQFSLSNLYKNKLRNKN